MKEHEIQLIEEELETIYELFDKNLTPGVFNFFTEGLSGREQSIIKSDLKSKGICVDPTIDDYRRELKMLIDHLNNIDISISLVQRSILVTQWKLDNIDSPLKKPLTKSEVCKAINLQEMDYDDGINIKVYRFIKSRTRRDYSAVLLEYGIMKKEDIDVRRVKKDGDVLSPLRGELECSFLDGHHSEKHVFTLTIHYDCRNFDKEEVLLLFIREAEKNLYELGKQDTFMSGHIYFKGGMGDQAIGCLIDYVDGKYVFYYEAEVKCRERTIFYPLEKAGTELIKIE